MMNDPNGSLSRGEFQIWQKEHQKFLDTKFGELHNQLASHIAVVDEVKTTRKNDWKTHKNNHKKLDESLKEKFVCKQDKINRNLKYIWISIAALFLVLLISHPDAVGHVGKSILGVFK